MFDYTHAGLADVTATIRAARRRASAATRRRRRARRGDRARPRRRFGRGRRTGRGRGRCSSSAGSGWRCAASTRAAASASCTTCCDAAGRRQRLRRRDAAGGPGERPSRSSARRPDVILELRAANSALPAGGSGRAERLARSLPSVPAVRSGRVHFLFDAAHRRPGPARGRGHRAAWRARCTRRRSRDENPPVVEQRQGQRVDAARAAARTASARRRRC